MICPHCGKETGETITINAVAPNVNACNPITWLPNGNALFPNAFAAAGCNPMPNYTILNPAPYAPQQTLQFTYDASTGYITQEQTTL